MTWNVQLDCRLICGSPCADFAATFSYCPCVGSPYCIYTCELKFCSCMDKFCVNKVIFFFIHENVLEIEQYNAICAFMNKYFNK